jgi:HORMA domain-containing protein
VSTGTGTSSFAYTKVDVAKVVDRFTADFHMIGQSTGLASAERAHAIGHDVKLMAQRGYIDRVDLVLRNATGKTIRAAKYTTSTDAGLWTSDRPGNSLWPRQAGGTLLVVVTYASAWSAMGASAQQRFCADECWGSWCNSDVDTSYPGLVGRFDRRYASNSYGMERTLYQEEGW